MTAVAQLKPKRNLIAKFADRFSVDESKVMDILKSTAFKQRDGNPPTDEQMTALMIVADQYGLNPFVKEIYAYPDKANGIVPVVGVDGWSRIMNEHPQMDGIEFRYSEEMVTHKNKNCHVWIEAVITRKDRSKPIVVREYFDEVVRSVNYSTPWDSHPKRMHRHKTEIQAVRVAFGFAGIYDEDEAERIIEKDITPTVEQTEPPQVVFFDANDFMEFRNKYMGRIAKGEKKASETLAWVESRLSKKFTEAQRTEAESWEPIEGQATVVDDPFVAAMNKAEGAE